MLIISLFRKRPMPPWTPDEAASGRSSWWALCWNGPASSTHGLPWRRVPGAWCQVMALRSSKSTLPGPEVADCELDFLKNSKSQPSQVPRSKIPLTWGLASQKPPKQTVISKWDVGSWLVASVRLGSKLGVVRDQKGPRASTIPACWGSSGLSISPSLSGHHLWAGWDAGVGTQPDRVKPTWDPGRAGWQERCEAGKFHAGGKLGLTSSAHLAPRPRVMTVVGRSGSGLLEVPGNRQRQASALPMLSGLNIILCLLQLKPWCINTQPILDLNSKSWLCLNFYLDVAFVLALWQEFTLLQNCYLLADLLLAK